MDECASIGGPNGHHCDANTTVCVNTPGSYACRCKPGYGRLNSFECADIDECAAPATGSPCHLHATCTNSAGGYECRCEDGYEGDGYTCRRKSKTYPRAYTRLKLDPFPVIVVPADANRRVALYE